jgi:hypothetical protein
LDIEAATQSMVLREPVLRVNVALNGNRYQ